MRGVGMSSVSLDGDKKETENSLGGQGAGQQG